MGFFSWKTQDTDKSIANASSCRETFTVYMKDDKGNSWREDSYAGYGDFQGKDFYELLAEMNGLGSDRKAGIDAAHADNPDPNLKWPTLTESPDAVVSGEPENCKDQGFFYDEFWDEMNRGET